MNSKSNYEVGSNKSECSRKKCITMMINENVKEQSNNDSTIVSSCMMMTSTKWNNDCHNKTNNTKKLCMKSSHAKRRTHVNTVTNDSTSNNDKPIMLHIQEKQKEKTIAHESTTISTKQLTTKLGMCQIPESIDNDARPTIAKLISKRISKNLLYLSSSSQSSVVDSFSEAVSCVSPKEYGQPLSQFLISQYLRANVVYTFIQFKNIKISHDPSINISCYLKQKYHLYRCSFQSDWRKTILSGSILLFRETSVAVFGSLTNFIIIDTISDKPVVMSKYPESKYSEAKFCYVAISSNLVHIIERNIDEEDCLNSSINSIQIVTSAKRATPQKALRRVIEQCSPEKVIVSADSNIPTKSMKSRRFRFRADGDLILKLKQTTSNPFLSYYKSILASIDERRKLQNCPVYERNTTNINIDVLWNSDQTNYTIEIEISIFIMNSRPIFINDKSDDISSFSALSTASAWRILDNWVFSQVDPNYDSSPYENQLKHIVLPIFVIPHELIDNDELLADEDNSSSSSSSSNNQIFELLFLFYHEPVPMIKQWIDSTFHQKSRIHAFVVLVSLWCFISSLASLQDTYYALELSKNMRTTEEVAEEYRKIRTNKTDKILKILLISNFNILINFQHLFNSSHKLFKSNCLVTLSIIHVTSYNICKQNIKSMKKSFRQFLDSKCLPLNVIYYLNRLLSKIHPQITDFTSKTTLAICQMLPSNHEEFQDLENELNRVGTITNVPDKSTALPLEIIEHDNHQADEAPSPEITVELRDYDALPIDDLPVETTSISNTEKTGESDADNVSLIIDAESEIVQFPSVQVCTTPISLTELIDNAYLGADNASTTTTAELNESSDVEIDNASTSSIVEVMELADFEADNVSLITATESEISPTSPIQNETTLITLTELIDNAYLGADTASTLAPVELLDSDNTEIENIYLKTSAELKKYTNHGDGRSRTTNTIEELMEPCQIEAFNESARENGLLDFQRSKQCTFAKQKSAPLSSYSKFEIDASSMTLKYIEESTTNMLNDDMEQCSKRKNNNSSYQYPITKRIRYNDHLEQIIDQNLNDLTEDENEESNSRSSSPVTNNTILQTKPLTLGEKRNKELRSWAKACTIISETFFPRLKSRVKRGWIEKAQRNKIAKVRLQTRKMKLFRRKLAKKNKMNMNVLKKVTPKFSILDLLEELKFDNPDFTGEIALCYSVNTQMKFLITENLFLNIETSKNDIQKMFTSIGLTANYHAQDNLEVFDIHQEPCGYNKLNSSCGSNKLEQLKLFMLLSRSSRSIVNSSENIILVKNLSDDHVHIILITCSKVRMFVIKLSTYPPHISEHMQAFCISKLADISRKYDIILHEKAQLDHFEDIAHLIQNAHINVKGLDDIDIHPGNAFISLLRILCAAITHRTKDGILTSTVDCTNILLAKSCTGSNTCTLGSQLFTLLNDSQHENHYLIPLLNPPKKLTHLDATQSQDLAYTSEDNDKAKIANNTPTTPSSKPVEPSQNAKYGNKPLWCPQLMSSPVANPSTTVDSYQDINSFKNETINLECLYPITDTYLRKSLIHSMEPVPSTSSAEATENQQCTMNQMTMQPATSNVATPDENNPLLIDLRINKNQLQDCLHHPTVRSGICPINCYDLFSPPIVPLEQISEQNSLLTRPVMEENENSIAERTQPYIPPAHAEQSFASHSAQEARPVPFRNNNIPRSNHLRVYNDVPVNQCDIDRSRITPQMVMRPEATANNNSQNRDVIPALFNQHPPSYPIDVQGTYHNSPNPGQGMRRRIPNLVNQSDTPRTQRAFQYPTPFPNVFYPSESPDSSISFPYIGSNHVQYMPLALNFLSQQSQNPFLFPYP